MKNFLYLISPFLILACSSSNPIKKVDRVDLNRFMGKWYVIANIPTFVEEGAHNAVETYTWNEKEQRIDVAFTFLKDHFDGKRKTYTQKAFVYDPSGNEWRIQFFWPFKFAYLIMDLAPDYSYTVIGVPNRNYIWIMSKTPTLPDAAYQEIIKKIKDQGYDTSLIKKVPQKW
jgi:apolipoprotein D and lipocalin family protein